MTLEEWDEAMLKGKTIIQQSQTGSIQ
jgi:hypothetical protein